MVVLVVRHFKRLAQWIPFHCFRLFAREWIFLFFDEAGHKIPIGGVSLRFLKSCFAIAAHAQGAVVLAIFVSFRQVRRVPDAVFLGKNHTEWSRTE